MSSPQFAPASAPDERGPGEAPLLLWRLAIYVSLLFWLAMAAGNIALFMVRPETHWPAVEVVEACQVASLIPIALLLHRVNHRVPASCLITAAGVVAATVAVAIDIGFATGAVAFGVGTLGGPVFDLDFLVLLLWLLSANALAWRAATLPPATAILGMATAITATLLYPAWAGRLARTVSPIRTKR